TGSNIPKNGGKLSNSGRNISSVSKRKSNSMPPEPKPSETAVGPDGPDDDQQGGPGVENPFWRTPFFQYMPGFPETARKWSSATRGKKKKRARRNPQLEAYVKESRHITDGHILDKL